MDDLDKWRRRNAQRLIAAGLPVDVVQKPRRFFFTVREAWDPDWAGGTGWTIAWIDDDQAHALLALLQEGFEDPVGWDLIWRLRLRIDMCDQ